MTPHARMQLYQLASQSLPIGGFSHSHGLEAAVEAGIVRSEASLRVWILDLLRFSVGSYEAPMLLSLRAAWGDADFAAVARLNEEFLATREAAELRAASVQMGFSMRSLLGQLAQFPQRLQRELASLSEPAAPCVWAAAGAAWSIPAPELLGAYLWSWAENQVLAGIKAVPLGQSAGQRLLLEIGAAIAATVSAAETAAAAAPAAVGPAGIGSAAPRAGSNFAPALAILSATHETQYSRLFRS